MTSRHWHRLARLPEREAPKTSAIHAPGSSKHCLAWLAAQWAGGCPPDRSGLRRYPGDSPFQPWTLLAITARDALTAPPRVASERSCGRRRIRAPSVDHRPRYAPGPQESAAALHRLQGAPGRRPRHRRDPGGPRHASHSARDRNRADPRSRSRPTGPPNRRAAIDRGDVARALGGRVLGPSGTMVWPAVAGAHPCPLLQDHLPAEPTGLPLTCAARRNAACHARPDRSSVRPHHPQSVPAACRVHHGPAPAAHGGDRPDELRQPRRRLLVATRTGRARMRERPHIEHRLAHRVRRTAAIQNLETQQRRLLMAEILSRWPTILSPPTARTRARRVAGPRTRDARTVRLASCARSRNTEDAIVLPGAPAYRAAMSGDR